jgi:hypothetical protein
MGMNIMREKQKVLRREQIIRIRDSEIDRLKLKQSILEQTIRLLEERIKGESYVL